MNNVQRDHEGEDSEKNDKCNTSRVDSDSGEEHQHCAASEDWRSASNEWSTASNRGLDLQGQLLGLKRKAAQQRMHRGKAAASV